MFFTQNFLVKELRLALDSISHFSSLEVQFSQAVYRDQTSSTLKKDSCQRWHQIFNVDRINQILVRKHLNCISISLHKLQSGLVMNIKVRMRLSKRRIPMTF